MYIPDNWVVLRFDNDNEVLYKILVGWSGGYLHGDSWKINSGIVKVEETKDYYDVFGYSGSRYRCRKQLETLRNNNAYIFNKLVENFPNKVHIVEMEVLKQSGDIEFEDINDKD